jgi:hypothetical protein
MDVIKADEDYYAVELNWRPSNEILDWCFTTFGDGNNGRWHYRYPNICFTNESDRLLFVLRWS